MDKADLTIIYYTANLINDSFAHRVRGQLFIASQGLPIISVSKKPLDFGLNISDAESERSIINVYKVILMAAKMAKTEFVALAEDDALYTTEHFHSFRPPADLFAYNKTRWNIFSWSKPPFFSLKFRRTLSSLIAPRKLLIEAFEERFKKYPDTSKIPLNWMGEPGRGHERKLKVTPRKGIDFFTYEPVVVFSHPKSYGFEAQGIKKRAGYIRAYDIPYWGTAKKIIKDFYRE